MTSYTFLLISQGGKLFRTHSFRSKVVLLAERNIMLRDQSECSKWSRKQAQNLILHIFLIIIIIIRCSGMFRDVPCSWFYRRPIKTLINNYLVKERALYRLNERFVSNITGDILFFGKVGTPYRHLKISISQVTCRCVPKHRTFP